MLLYIQSASFSALAIGDMGLMAPKLMRREAPLDASGSGVSSATNCSRKKQLVSHRNHANSSADRTTQQIQSFEWTAPKTDSEQELGHTGTDLGG